jgi:hypothetical protein
MKLTRNPFLKDFKRSALAEEMGVYDSRGGEIPSGHTCNAENQARGKFVLTSSGLSANRRAAIIQAPLCFGNSTRNARSHCHSGLVKG